MEPPCRSRFAVVFCYNHVGKTHFRKASMFRCSLRRLALSDGNSWTIAKGLGHRAQGKMQGAGGWEQELKIDY